MLTSSVLCILLCHDSGPEKVEGDLPSYPGFEKDVFGVVRDYFMGLPEPLITYELYDVIINVFGQHWSTSILVWSFTALNSLHEVWLCQLAVSQLQVSASTSAHFTALNFVLSMSACVAVTSLYYCTSAHSQLWILFVLSDCVSLWCRSYNLQVSTSTSAHSQFWILFVLSGYVALWCHSYNLQVC